MPMPEPPRRQAYSRFSRAVLSSSAFERLAALPAPERHQHADMRAFLIAALESMGVQIEGHPPVADLRSACHSIDHFDDPISAMLHHFGFRLAQLLSQDEQVLRMGDITLVPTDEMPPWAFGQLAKIIKHSYAEWDYVPMPDWWPPAKCPWNDTGVFDGMWVRQAAEPGYVHALMSLEHARADRWTSMRAGRWLTKFAGHLGENERRGLVERFACEKVRAAMRHALEITSSAERARWAYETKHLIENTAQISCMCEPRFTNARYHPAEAYVSDDPSGAFGARDLGVAILVDTETETPVARSVVWPAKRVFVRLYGVDAPSTKLLRARLEEAGYQRVAGFAGAELRKIRLSRTRLLAPFLDGACRTVRIRGKRLRVVAQPPCDLILDTTDGWVPHADGDEAPWAGTDEDAEHE